MQIYTRGVARIRHSETGQVYEIYPSEVEWDEVGGDERQMGAEMFYAATIEHPELGNLTWEISEYPIGAENFRETDVGKHELLENFEFGFAHEPDGPDDRQEIIDEMVSWFFANYEDPVHEMPYIGKEGGYQYIRGGPYDAREVISDQFPDLPESWHEAAVAKIEEDGTVDWAPVDRGPDADEAPPADLEEWDDAEFPEQEPGLQFKFGADGRIELHHSDPPQPDEHHELEGLLDALIEAVNRLVSSLSGTNAHGGILNAAQAYQLAINADELSIGRVYATGIRLENARDALRRNDDLPPLPEEPDEALTTVLDLHGVLIASTEQGRTLLESAREYARSEAETAEDRARKAQLADAIYNAPALFEDHTRELVVELLKESGSGRHPERSSEASNTAIRNLLRVAIGVGGPIVLSAVGAGFIDSLPGQLIANETTIAANAIWSFVTQNIGLLQELAAVHGPDMRPIRTLLDRIADRIR